MSRPSSADLLGLDVKPDPGEDGQFTPGDWALIRTHGVGIDWLAGAFRMDRRKVRAKLAPLKPLGQHKTPTGTRPVYDLREASAYLSPNIEQIHEAIRNMSASDLPPGLQTDVWDARLKEMKWREQAGELYRADDVREVFADTFKTIKQTMQLWADNLDRGTELPPGVRAKLIVMVDGLQDEIHKALVEMPKKKQTKPIAADLPEVATDA